MEYRVENDATFKIRTEFFSNILRKEDYKNDALVERDFMLDFKSKKKVKYTNLRKMTNERINQLLNIKNMKYRYEQAGNDKSVIDELLIMKDKMDDSAKKIENTK